MKTGKCKFSENGNDCKVSHNVLSKSTTERPKSRSPSAGTKKQIPCARFQVGSCKYGDKCYYMHTLVKTLNEEQAAAPAVEESSARANSPIGSVDIDF